MTRFRWAIFGTGAISAKFVAGLSAAKEAEVVVVASRSLDRARSLAAGLGIAKATQGYAETVAAGGFDAAYIASPPSEHAAHALLCIEAGVPVLVEKPFASTAQEAKRVADAARANSVFAMEAMWTRFLPASLALKDLVSSGAIGNIRLISGSFGTSQIPSATSSMFSSTLGGGAVAHLGIYPISLAQWLFGSHSHIQTMGTVGASGVEEDVTVSLRYSNNVLGSFLFSSRAWAPDQLYLMGERGIVSLRGSIVRPNGLNVVLEEPRSAEKANFDWRARMRQHYVTHRVAQILGRSSRARSERRDYFYSGNGYHYEADEVRRCVQSGLVESPTMPLQDSVDVASIADAIRHSVFRDQGSDLR